MPSSQAFGPADVGESLAGPSRVGSSVRAFVRARALAFALDFALWAHRAGRPRRAAVILGLAGLGAGLLACVASGALLAWGARSGFASFMPPGGALVVGGVTWLAGLLVGLPVVWLLLELARHIEGLQARLAPLLEASAAVSARAAAAAPFVLVVEREWARARRYGHGAAVLLVGVDRHMPGIGLPGKAAMPALLEGMEREIRRTLRGGDALAPWAENQLAVFLANGDAMGALDTAERIRERLEQLRVDWQGRILQATVSVGVAALGPMHSRPQALLEGAASALLAARRAGGNCVRAAPADAGVLPAPGSSIDDKHAGGPF